MEKLTCEAPLGLRKDYSTSTAGWDCLNIEKFILYDMQASNPEKVLRHGRCPLTPEEVGLMLRALGFGSDVHLYVASGEVYGGEETMAPLKALFPNFHSKETIASKEELAPFLSFSSRMAALDFIVCDESDVFVTNNNGNMARMLAGRRYIIYCFKVGLEAILRMTLITLEFYFYFYFYKALLVLKFEIVFRNCK